MYDTDFLKGVGLIAVFGLCIGGTYIFYRKEKYTFALYCILLCGFTLRLFCACDPFLHEWDEKFHALVAKNLVETPLTPRLFPVPNVELDYKDWDKNHIWLHKQPLSLWSIALSIYLFGTSVFDVRLPSLIYSTVSIFFTYLIGKKLFDEKTGLCAALLQAVNGYVIELCAGRAATDHVDTLFMFLIQGSILCCINYKSNRVIATFRVEFQR